MNIYEKLSAERKELQAKGLVPEWYTTAGWQMFKSKYLYGTDRAVRGQFERIAATAAKHLAHIGKEEEAKEKFFELMWNGWLSLSTPVMSNMGTDKGMPVSCAGSYVGDSIDQFYRARLETAALTKNGFGTAAYLGDIRPRGSKISRGGTASGVLPVYKGFVQDSREVSQGTRRGAWAGYLPIDHGDFDEICDYIGAEVDDCNVGWNVSDAFIARLNKGDEEAIRRFQKVMTLKMKSGRGYLFFPDKANRRRPQMYKDRGLDIKAPQLCNEIMLHSSKDYTYTCVLSSINLVHWDVIKNTDAIFWATVFLDCVAEEFIQKAESDTFSDDEKQTLAKAVRFTKAGRALGLGTLGFHTYLQQESIPFESLEAHFKNIEMFKKLSSEAKRASQWMAKELGEPEWCVGYGVRNTHVIAQAPTKSSASLMGGVSEGISPDPAMTYTQDGAAGEIDRIVGPLLKIMKERGVYNEETINDLTDKLGSVQHVNWLSDHEKEVFKTAFEINQKVVLRLASARADYIDQWQSLNLFFGSEEDPAWIAEVHQEAFEDPKMLGLYYVYTQAGVQASKGECLACQ